MRRSTQRATRLVAVGAAAVLLLAPAAAASADPATDGFWYYDAFKIQDAHDAGLTGEGVTIAVIDTQINLDVPTLAGADIEVQDSQCYDSAGVLIPPTTTSPEDNGHGTNIVSYLVGSGDGYPGQTGVKGIVPDAKIIFTSLGSTGADQSSGFEIICNAKDPGKANEAMAQGVNAAIAADADIISISASAPASGELIQALATAINKGIVVVSGVSNDIFSADDFGNFPGDGNGVVSVQSMDSTTAIQGDHSDPNTDVVGPGVNLVWQGEGAWENQSYKTGTSLATPVVAGFLALVAQKYPDATGNQLIQTLINNTGADDHALEYDETFQYGFGIASATHMLRVDPTQYEDTNPLITDDPDAVPTAAMIANPTGASDDPSTSDPSETPSDEGFPVLPLVLGALGLLVVIGIIILIIVLASRRSRTPTA